MKLFGLIGLAAFLSIVALILFEFAPRMSPAPTQSITSFEECVAAGNPVMESYPRQCNTPDGKHFVEDVSPVPLPTTANGCVVAGCSGQLCVSAAEAGNIVTTCEFRAEYACYQNASCEPQANGECGWTLTPELQSCLANPPSLEGGIETY